MEINSAAHVGVGVHTRPAERSSAGVSGIAFEQFQAIEAPASCAGPPGRGRPGLRVLLVATAFVFASSFASGQTTGKTVRHHKVEVEDPSSPPQLIQAESAIEKKDYLTAEPLLKKVVTDDSQNFAAWFDLG